MGRRRRRSKGRKRRKRRNHEIRCSSREEEEEVTDLWKGEVRALTTECVCMWVCVYICPQAIGCVKWTTADRKCSFSHTGTGTGSTFIVPGNNLFLRSWTAYMMNVLHHLSYHKVLRILIVVFFHSKLSSTFYCKHLQFHNAYPGNISTELFGLWN